MKKLKRILSMLLVVCMIFTSQAFVAFAEGMENAEAIVKETTIEETTVKETEETTVETTVKETIIGENSKDSANNELISPDVDEKEESTETEYAEEPEEDEIETETRTGELSEPEDFVGAKLGELEEIEVNTEDKLLGATKYLSHIMISQYTTKTYHVGDTYDPSDLKIKAYYEDADTGDEEMVEVAYTDDKSKFSFSPDCVNSPFTASTTEEDPYELEITYTDGASNASASISFQVYPAPTPTPKYFNILYISNETHGKRTDGLSSETPDVLDFMVNGVFTRMDDGLKGWHIFTPDNPEDPSSVEDNYDPDFSGTADYPGTKEGLKQAYNDWNNTPTDNMFIGGMFESSTPASDKNFYVLYYADADDYAKGYASLSEIHFSSTAGEEAITEDTLALFANLPNAEPRGFYRVISPFSPPSYADNLDDAKNWYDDNKVKAVDPTVAALRTAYTEWVTAGATTDIFYGALNDAYTYSFYYEGTTAKLKKFKCTDDKSDVEDYINTVKSNVPTGKKFKKWRYWHADWYVNEHPGMYYDFSDNGELDFYKNIENKLEREADRTDEEFISFFDSWKANPSGNMHFGAVYEDDTPAPTPVTTDWYWYLDGTHMHYTATNGTGRTKVTFNGDLGVDYGSTDVTTVTEVTIDDKISPENLHGLFRRFTSLTKINSFTNLDTSNCTDMARMFQGCSSLESINVSHFNTSKVKDMSRVFHICEKLKSVDVSNFDTQNAEKMYQMFGTCLVITNIKFSSKFVTNKVTEMYEMFSRCEIITSLDISSFDVSSITNANDMFASCHELVTIKTSPTLDFSSVSKGNSMFSYSFKIKGGKGTTYDENHVDKSYAHVDGGTSNPGYFTSSGSPTPPGPTPPGPTPPSPGGGGKGGSSSGDSNPEKGPMGDLTKNPMYQQQLQNQQLNTTNNIPQTSLLTDTTLISTLQSYSQNQYMPKANARDQYGNTGFGQWQRVPGTTTWYFLSGDLNSNETTGTVGLLTNGWYNLGWDGQDKWYHFDENGVMGLGWYQENEKIYYLQDDFTDNWYGKAVTGQQIIGGQVYNFDASGALIS